MGLGSAIRDLEKNLFRILDNGSRCQKGTGSRIRIRNTAAKKNKLKPVLEIRDILARIRTRGSVPLIWDPDPTPFFSDLKDAKKLFFCL
jgi:hypothetical protein